MSDHYFGEGGLQNDQLYMTTAEQRAALVAAGFSTIVEIAAFGSLVMHVQPDSATGDPKA